MKKAFLLFIVLFTFCAINVSAQTAATDSTKQLLPVDTSKAASITQADTIKKIVKTVKKRKRSIAALKADTVAFKAYLATNYSLFLTMVNIPAGKLKTDSLQLAEIKMPAEINVPPLLSGTILKSSNIQQAVADMGPLSSLFPPVTDNDLQNGIIRYINNDFDEVNRQFAAVIADSLRAVIPQKMPAGISNLNKHIALISNDSTRAAYYQQIANHYLHYDSITIRKTRQIYQDAAIEYTLKALHSYTRAVDGYGIMNCYTNLSKVYTDQKKYSQAKWFILQANTRARNLFDVPYTLSTLVSLANIKMEIKDYKLAKTDLDEALSLASQHHLPKQEAVVQQSFGALYIYLDDPKKSMAAIKRHDAIEDSIIKAAELQRLAAIATQDSVQQTKKKADTLSGKKPGIKTNSPRRIVSI